MADLKNYLQYINFPEVPESLLESHDDIINKPPKLNSVIDKNYQYFQTRPVNKDLLQWTKDIIGHHAWPQYQIIKYGLPIHRDPARHVAFNYILNTGGISVITGFFNDNKQILCLEQIKLKSWHRIKTDVLHGVFGITHVRIALSIEISNYRWDDDMSDQLFFSQCITPNSR